MKFSPLKNCAKNLVWMMPPLRKHLNADLILTMTSMNKASVLNMIPDVYDKLYTLKEYVFSFKEDLPADFYDGTSDIAVPRAGDVGHNINCAAQIYYLVWSIASELSEHGEIVMKNTILQ